MIIKFYKIIHAKVLCSTSVLYQQLIMAAKSKEDSIADVILDPISHKPYSKGRFMGKGGFARCYELIDLETKQVYAGKIVSKSLLSKQSQKDKMAQEISIHRSLKHHNVVKFYSFFEDSANVYIILELCRRRSLMEMHKRRKNLTEPEVRYFMRQLLNACKYLHDNRVIHRDLKLGNLFLNDEMELKVGDFGLATRLEFDGERKLTLCGTPNYIAPEILNKKGHSFEVDIWSLGCILYTLLVGKPPFETNNLKDTYVRIKKNEYHIPSKISVLARSLIQRMLQLDPSKRPTMEGILADEFMTSGYTPSRLPTSCLTTTPRFDRKADFSMIVTSSRKPLLEVNAKAVKEDVALSTVKSEGENVKAQLPLSAAQPRDASPQEGGGEPNKEEEDQGDLYLSELFRQLAHVVSSKPLDRAIVQEDDAEDPAAAPMLWISKWVDYSDKYGLGYQLCDNSVGVLFNDHTKLVLLNDGENIHYIERDGKEHYYTLHGYPTELAKKVTLLDYFRKYMNEHLLKAGAAMVPREGDELVRLPYMRSWFRTRSAIILYLTNGTLQINFFQDHTKVVLCPLMNAVTYIDGKREARTFRLNLIETFGCSKELHSRLRYARTMVERLLAAK